MSTAFQPMLAAKCAPEDVDKLMLPGFLSPKLDGIRAIVRGGIVLSRKLKPIPSRSVQRMFGSPNYEGMDGELMLGNPTAPDVFRRTTSAVMSDNNPEAAAVVFQVFDTTGELADSWPFHERLLALTEQVDRLKNPNLLLVPQLEVGDTATLDAAEQMFVKHGFEGAIYRTRDGLYKHGRSTFREQYLVKIKRFEDAEAIIEGFEEKMHNANEAQVDERGYTKRTSHKENQVPMNTLGALRVRGMTGTYKDVEFKIGTGFDDRMRELIWNHREDWLGLTVKFSYFPLGSKDAPRFPVYLGVRKD